MPCLALPCISLPCLALHCPASSHRRDYFKLYRVPCAARALFRCSPVRLSTRCSTLHATPCHRLLWHTLPASIVLVHLPRRVTTPAEPLNRTASGCPNSPPRPHQVDEEYVLKVGERMAQVRTETFTPGSLFAVATVRRRQWGRLWGPLIGSPQVSDAKPS